MSVGKGGTFLRTEGGFVGCPARAIPTEAGTTSNANSSLWANSAQSLFNKADYVDVKLGPPVVDAGKTYLVLTSDRVVTSEPPARVRAEAWIDQTTLFLAKTYVKYTYTPCGAVYEFAQTFSWL